MAKSYQQFCPIAVGLDLIGDRWTILIVRELSFGDQRFTDLRTALAGIAPNLLSERLRQLGADGLVEHVELAPPAARTVYRLTDRGREALPVLRALARFGASSMPDEPPPAFPQHRALLALLAPWQTRTAKGLDVTLALDGAVWRLTVDGQPRVEPGEPGAVAFATTLRGLGQSRREGVALRVARVRSRRAAEAFAAAFGLELS